MEDKIICEQLFDASEILDAKKIVEKIYIREGYINSDTKSNTISKYLDYKDTAIFGLKINGNLFGTMSIVFGTDHSLPMDSIYKKELDSFRNEGSLLAEFTQLALDEDLFLSLRKNKNTESKTSLLSIFSKAVKYAIEQKVTNICIAVNPKHVNFYKLLGFGIVGEEKHYGAVEAPAVALVLDLKSEASRKRLDRVIGLK